VLLLNSGNQLCVRLANTRHSTSGAHQTRGLARANAGVRWRTEMGKPGVLRDPSGGGGRWGITPAHGLGMQGDEGKQTGGEQPRIERCKGGSIRARVRQLCQSIFSLTGKQQGLFICHCEEHLRRGNPIQNLCGGRLPRRKRSSQ
jgi:hypothetical protein